LGRAGTHDRAMGTHKEIILSKYGMLRKLLHVPDFRKQITFFKEK
jgi:hypothetical protein